MAVSYMTNHSTASTLVLYGLSADALSMNATGYETSYYQTIHHHTVLSNLSASTTYYYSAGDAAGGFSPVNSFRTARVAGAADEFPLNIAVFGDMSDYNSANTFVDLQRISNDLDFILHIGDVSYADDDFLHNPLVDKLVICLVSLCFIWEAACMQGPLRCDGGVVQLVMPAVYLPMLCHAFQLRGDLG